MKGEELLPIKLPRARSEYPRQRRRHWTKPTWWERTKKTDGTWTAVPHYGQPLFVNGKRVSR